MQQQKDITKRERLYILEKMPVNNAIWTLAIPTMMAMMVQIIYNMTDTFFIGQLNDANMVAAISISMPIFLIIQAFGNIFAIGGASVISRFLGKGENDRASKAGAIAFWSSLSTCAAVSIIGFIFMDQILMLCGASVNTIDYAKNYLTIIIIGSPFMGLKMSLSGLLRSEGATKESMIGMMLGSGLNIVLDPIFILVLSMGVKGAALATILGNMIGVFYFLSFYFKKRGVISINPSLFSFDGQIYKEIFKIGIPASIGMVLMSIGNAVANVFASSFGDSTVAAMGIVMRTTSIGVVLTMGLSHGCQPLMGYSYGAGNYSRLISTIKRAILIGTMISSTFAVIFFLFPETVIRIFINDAEVIQLGSALVKVYILSMPFLGVQMVLMTMFQSLGKMVESLIISLGRQGLFFIPALIILSKFWGFDGFKFAQPIASIATALLSAALFFRLRKKLFVRESQTEESELDSDRLASDENA